MDKESVKKLVTTFNTDAVVELTQQMVRIPSVVIPGEEAKMSAFVESYMNACDIPAKARSIDGIDPSRKNVIAVLKGSGEAAPLAFSGHMDVVPVSDKEREKWDYDPFGGEITDEGFMYGRGSSDMKGGLAGAMTAMKFLKDNDIVPPGDIILCASVDEEDLMRGVKAMLNYPELQNVKGVVVCEGTGLKLSVASRGRTWADVTFEGESAHASLKGAGNNAIVYGADFINRLYDHEIPYEPHELLGDYFWQANVVHGGVEPAIVPDHCTITVDARLIPGITSDHVWSEVQNILDQMHAENEKCVAHINILEAREPWETDLNSSLYHLAKDSYDLVGIEMKHRGQTGTTDGTYLRRLGMESVILGPGQTEYIHKANEKVLIENLRNAARLYLTMMLSNSLK